MTFIMEESAGLLFSFVDEMLENSQRVPIPVRAQSEPKYIQL